MSSDPDFLLIRSLHLSKILDDKGVNEGMIIRRRRVGLLEESLINVSYRARGSNKTDYIFGSTTEGSSTLALRCDTDYLRFYDDVKIVTDGQNYKGSETQKFICKMIENDNTPTGYCYLKCVFCNDPDKNLEDKYVMHNVSYVDSLKKVNDGIDYEQHGPAIKCNGKGNFNDQDYVDGYYCNTWPKAAKHWLTEDGIGHWPTKEMKSFAENGGCFLVPVGSKDSQNERIEYRISTSLAERCLMFSLNITQLRCYILMKMILKKYINSEEEECIISSYVCKNVLFHCIRHSPHSIWTESKLMECFTLYLLALQYFVLKGNCPHFIIHDNNLLRGRLPYKTRLMKEAIKIRKLLLSYGDFIFHIKYDNLGIMLHEVETGKPPSFLHIEQERKYSMGVLLRDTGKNVQDFYRLIIFEEKYIVKDVREGDEVLSYLYSCLSNLITFHKSGSHLERLACRLLATELSSTIGSLLASRNIMSSAPILKVSLEWLNASLDSNVSSNRLKKASVFYCSGKIETALSVIKDVERRYDLNTVEPVCRCTEQPSHRARDGFNKVAECHNENGIKYAVAYCVNFLRCESNCMPRELYLEMYRTTKSEKSSRHPNNRWLDLAFIDSLTYLLFLKYMIYGRLGNISEQDQALKDLIRAIYFEPNLGHRETGLNLVGQIMIAKGKLFTALRFFLLSHEVQPQFNAAKIHICSILATLVEKSVPMFSRNSMICAKNVDNNKNKRINKRRKKKRKISFF